MGRITQVLAGLNATAGLVPLTGVSIPNFSIFKASSIRTAEIASVNILRDSNIDNEKISKRSKSASNVEDKTVLGDI